MRQSRAKRLKIGSHFDTCVRGGAMKVLLNGGNRDDTVVRVNKGSSRM
jgi:hypothetical protein